MMQQDNHIFQGMRRDNHPIRQEKQFLWDAHNIRLTTRDGNTMLSITNEKSTEELITFERNETYIGHTVIGDYLILLTTGLEKDRIYRINLNSGIGTKEILYEGTDLSFDADHPAQMISDYESKLIQKVYWVDGKNPPRVINVAKPELLKKPISEDTYKKIYNDAPFNFVQNLELKEGVSVERNFNASGLFPAGTIQYALTYYNKYGQESNIFWTSELLYSSFEDRGGSPEDVIRTSFTISVKNVQNNFDYIRIYSIIRTSIDATPTVKRVADIEISEDAKKITYTDTNTTGDIVDPSRLLYIGGKDIIAECITSKDNTLFLGNISYNRQEVSSIFEEDILNKLEISCEIRELLYNNFDSGQKTYKYFNQLSKNSSTFKTGETYRLGFQAQYKTGEWSEPVFVKDKIMEGFRPCISKNSLTLPVFKMSIKTLEDSLKGNGYLKIRPLIVLPETKDMSVIAQGILCPTVFNIKAREENTPFAQSSWFIRPYSYNYQLNNLHNVNKIPEYRHYHLIPSYSDTNFNNEIQNTLVAENRKEQYSLTGNHKDGIDLKKVAGELEKDNRTFNSLYGIDNSIVTFHSPDIEFNDKIKEAINNNTSLKVRIVGYTEFSSSVGDINIQTSTTVASPDAGGFIHKSMRDISNGASSIISGYFYEDMAIDENGKEFWESKPLRNWITYLWHRSGSLNNDCVRPTDRGTRTSQLKKKIISNSRYSKDNVWLKTPHDLSTSELHMFDSNEVSLTKIKDTHNKKGDISYYGNVDSLNVSYQKYQLITTASNGYKLLKKPVTFKGSIKESTSDNSVSFSFIVIPRAGNKDTGVLEGDITEGSVVLEDTTIDFKGCTFGVTFQGKNYEGYVSKDDSLYVVSGISNYSFPYVPLLSGETEISLDNPVPIGSDRPDIGDYQEALALSKDPVRIKYKSTPHVVFATNYMEDKVCREPLPSVTDYIGFNNINSDALYWLPKADPSFTFTPSTIDISENKPINFVWLAEIYQEVNDELRFGGKSPEAKRNNLWVVAGPAISTDGTEDLVWEWGDTWYQRYDCLKTYPFTEEDENQMVEIGSFMCETRVNIDGRYDRNRGQDSNLYMRPTNFNLINPVYTQKNSFFNYRILDEDYYKVNQYPSQILWTGTKLSGSIQDEWTNLHMANSLDLDGKMGQIRAIVSFNELLLGFQDRGLSQILFNLRVQIQATDGVPIEIANSQKVEGSRTISDSIGCQDKFSIVSSPMGIYFIDDNNHNIYKFDGQLNNIGLQLGTMYWARENYSGNTWKYINTESVRNGTRLYYDPKYQDIYFTPGSDSENREALCYSEQLGQFTSFMSYGGAVMFPYKAEFYSLANNTEGVLTLWKNFGSNAKPYNNIFGTDRGYSISFISNDNPLVTKVFDTIEMRADLYDNSDVPVYTEGTSEFSHTRQYGKPFNYIRVTNEYQDTDEKQLDDINCRKKFRAWRIILPRVKRNDRVHSLERVRNPWAKITLGWKQNVENPNNGISILHDIGLRYTI